MRPTQLQIQNHTNVLEIWSNAYVTQKQHKIFFKNNNNNNNKKAFFFWKKKIETNHLLLK